MRLAVTKRPRGRVPGSVKSALEEWSEFWALMVCPRCGRWYSYLDCFFPYHQEESRCKRCQPPEGDN